MVYINGRPFVLRDVERPFSNLEHTVCLTLELCWLTYNYGMLNTIALVTGLFIKDVECFCYLNFIKLSNVISASHLIGLSV